MTIVTYRHRPNRPLKKKPKGPELTSVIVGKSAAPVSIPVWEDGDPSSPAERWERLWREMVRRVQEATGETNVTSCDLPRRKGRK
jgi:hypothetical protein